MATTTERIYITNKHTELSALQDAINKFLEDSVGEVKDVSLEYIPNAADPNMNRRSTMYYAVIRYTPPVKK